MAKLMVSIDVPDASYEELAAAMLEKKKRKDFEKEGVVFMLSGRVIVNEKLFEQSEGGDDEYIFELIGVRP